MTERWPQQGWSARRNAPHFSFGRASGGSDSSSAQSAGTKTQRQQQQRTRRRALARLWTSPEVLRSLNLAFPSCLALGLMALVVIAVGLATRANGTISTRGWPSYGYYEAIPGSLMILVGPLSNGVQNLFALRFLTILCGILGLWEIYLTVGNIWWMVTYFLDTLPQALLAHQSAGFMSFVTITNIISVVLYLRTYLLLSTVCDIVPDLMIDMGLAPALPLDDDDDDEDAAAER